MTSPRPPPPSPSSSSSSSFPGGGSPSASTRARAAAAFDERQRASSRGASRGPHPGVICWPPRARLPPTAPPPSDGVPRPRDARRLRPLGHPAGHPASRHPPRHPRRHPPRSSSPSSSLSAQPPSPRRRPSSFLRFARPATRATDRRRRSSPPVARTLTLRVAGGVARAGRLLLTDLARVQVGPEERARRARPSVVGVGVVRGSAGVPGTSSRRPTGVCVRSTGEAGRAASPCDVKARRASSSSSSSGGSSSESGTGSSSLVVLVGRRHPRRRRGSTDSCERSASAAAASSSSGLFRASADPPRFGTFPSPGGVSRSVCSSAPIGWRTRA